MEAHGGRIWAESGGAGRGTRFTFTVPVADEAGVGAAAAGRRVSSAQTARPRILVVDGDPQTLRYVRDALTAAGYVAVVTGDPRDLPRLVRTKRPGLVLLDLMLPGTDGIELMERAPELAGLPIIFISGYRRDETIAKALRLGAADYIVKPFSPTELTARVQAALRRQGESAPFRLGHLAIDYEQRRVTVAGRAVELTATEYELLRVLSVNATRVLTYDSLLRDVWRGESGNAKLVRAIVKRLRRKLGARRRLQVGPTERFETARCAATTFRFTHLQGGERALGNRSGVDTDLGTTAPAAGRRGSLRRRAPGTA